MIRNQKPPAVRQQVLFSPAVQQVADLPTDKQRELQTAVAELLLNTLTSDDSSDSGETDDTSQTYA
jgi:anti-sigma regulatory factor (Ser/Thr protein kinase)